MMTAAAAAHVHVNSTRGSDGRLPVATLEASIPGRDVQTRAGGGPLPTRKKQKETDIWDLEKDQNSRLQREQKHRYPKFYCIYLILRIMYIFD
jgi:hypothetical protein